jgi:hypothetical protein
VESKLIQGAAIPPLWYTGGIALKAEKDDIVNLDKPKNNKQVYMIVDGCRISLNFPTKSEEITVSDIKRMMLVGIAKS